MPIRFACHAVLPQTPTEIAAKILDTTHWPDFDGYGPLPGIKSARFVTRTESIVGSEIQVENTDGSQHSERIVLWDPPHELRLRLGDFSPPLSLLADHFEERWEFQLRDTGCAVRRQFELHPRSLFTWPLVWMISWLLKGAVAKHLRQIQNSAA
ncbi:MAG: SRPBCC family protein [Planctomycetota bacterium]